MKKLILLIVAIVGFSLAEGKAQGTNWLKAGVNVGIPVGDVSKTYSFVLGADLKYQFLGIDSFGFGVSTGYTNFFGKKIEGTTVTVPDFGFVPLAGLFRYYATKNFFLGTDLGYGFNTVKNGKGGFYYRPEIGYHNKAWNIFAFYQGISLNKISPASVGIGINYNIIQGE